MNSPISALGSTVITRWGKVNELIKSYSMQIGVLITTLFLIGIAVYIIYTYVKPKLDPTFVPNREFVEAEFKEVTLYIFHTTWCPHSKKALKVFELVRDEVNTKDNLTDPKTKLFFTIVDAEKEEEVMGEFERTHGVKVEGYPTIFLVSGTKVVEFDAITTKETLMEFIETTM
jgi:hypothetical protein